MDKLYLKKPHMQLQPLNGDDFSKMRWVIYAPYPMTAFRALRFEQACEFADRLNEERRSRGQ